MPTLEQIKAKAAADAMLKLRFEVLPALDTVINGTPTGPVRDKLTEANIILQQIVQDASDGTR